MRKIILTIGLVLTILVSYAQNCDQATYYTEPATFTAEDEVKLFVDLSGCPVLASLDEVYVWIFVEGGPGPDGVGGNGDFCNGSNPALIMTDEGNDVWSFTFTPVDLFDATAAVIGTEIGFIPKAFAACKTAGDQTENLFLAVESLIFTPTEARTFPGKFATDDFVTLYFDQSLATNAAMSDLDEIYVYTWINRADSEGNALGDLPKAEWADVGTTAELKMSDEGNGLFSLTLVLDDFYPIDAGDVITQINYIFRNAEGTIQTDTFSNNPVVFD